MFVYYCPASSKVKQKMLYSTVKAAVTSAAERAGVKFSKRLELTDASEITPAALLDELYGPKKETGCCFFFFLLFFLFFAFAIEFIE